MAIRNDNDVIIIDAGLYFPELSAFGVDIALPDFRALDDEIQDIRAILITHGHEDHIGALGALSERVNAPVIGSRTSMALAGKRLEEAKAKNEVRIVDDYEALQLGSFRVTFLPVAHSVPDSMALKIDTSEGIIYHTGDFKLDPTPLDSRTTDLGPLAEMGSSGRVALLLIDSTNGEEPGWTESELAVRPGIEEVFAKHRSKRIICSCFASHIHRVAQIVAEARRHQRKIVPVGRSMVRVFEIARELGIIELPENEIASLKEVASLPPSQVCLLSTGSQGEPRAALSLMAREEHRHIQVNQEDVILLSSDAIPGNESDVGRLIDQLTRRGAEVIHAGMKKVHVSGHAKRDELRHVIAAANPQAVIPIHGEYRHMSSVAKLAREVYPESSVLVAEDGSVVQLATGSVREIGRFPAPYIYKSNTSADAIAGSVVQLRKTLQAGGVLILTAFAEDNKVQSVAAEQVGWLNSSMFETLADKIEESLRQMTDEALARGVSVYDIENHLQTRMRRVARTMTGITPHILVIFEYGSSMDVGDDLATT